MKYKIFLLLFSSCIFSIYMQGKDGPPGQHGIPGVKGDKVKITVFSQINHKCFNFEKLITQHYCINLSNLSQKHLHDGYTLCFHLKLFFLSFQGPQGEAGQEGAAGLHGEEVYWQEDLIYRFCSLDVTQM